MKAKKIVRYPQQFSPTPAGFHPKIWEIFSHRRIKSPDELDYQLRQLHPYQGLKDIEIAASRIVQAMENDELIVFVGDYDVDGATSCALGVAALKDMGASRVEYMVPNRFEFGYGLSPEIVEQVAKLSPDLLVTVDNGISSLKGAQQCQKIGLDVIITDHHLPGEQLPNATAIVNPNQPGDTFESKALAGVGVVFYVLMAVRALLREKGWFDRGGAKREVNLAQYLDLVALGTVADVVPLDANNRILVDNGLKRIRANVCRPGIKALIDVSGRNQPALTASDLGYALGPRINAAGRLEEINVGIDCLLSPSYKEALGYAQILDDINSERKHIEHQMQLEAESHLELLSKRFPLEDLFGIALYQKEWHQGVVGILASRVKEKWHVPTIIFASVGDGLLKGSGRSTEGIHMRDLLEHMSQSDPTLIETYGGHAMAAGLTIKETQFKSFALKFNQVVAQQLGNQRQMGEVLSDGELDNALLNLDFAHLLRDAGPWGQAFPEPVFDGKFAIKNKRILKGKHLKLQVSKINGSSWYDAIYFNAEEQFLEQLDDEVHFAYKLDINEFRGQKSIQLLIEHIEY